MIPDLILKSRRSALDRPGAPVAYPVGRALGFRRQRHESSGLAGIEAAAGGVLVWEIRAMNTPLKGFLA